MGLGGPKYGGGNVAMTTTFNAKGVAHQIPASRSARWVDWFGLEYPEGVSQRGRCLCGTPLGNAVKHILLEESGVCADCVR